MTSKVSIPRVFLLALLAALIAGCGLAGTQNTSSPQIVFSDQAAVQQDFERAEMPLDLVLPRDHGPHLNFQTEWWYFTGNLEAVDGGHFGYQFTLFRRGLAPGESTRSSTFATNQVYFAHLALTDVEAGEHRSTERFSRGAAGLAGSTADPLRIWLDDWGVDGLAADGSRLRLQARDGDLRLDLVLEADKPIVAHGNSGLSEKTSEPGNASYYLSYTRMKTSGTIEVGGDQHEVSGSSWFDHEWSTSALGADDVGWDWFGLQLEDGRELMLYRIRQADGSVEPVSGGTLVEADGTQVALQVEDVHVEVLGVWESPNTAAIYPAAWRIEIPSAGIVLEVEPYLADQEMRLSFVYWEGAVSVRGTSGGEGISGWGYVELTGYFESMAGVF